MGKKNYRSKKGAGTSLVWMLGTLAVGMIALWAWVEFLKPDVNIPGMVTYPSEGQEHVDASVTPTYKTDPPTSGPHYAVATPPGFYADAQPAGALVHSLEHGHIVIYYDPESTPTEVLEKMKSYAKKYPGNWDGVVVVPRQQDEAAVLTAWTKMLRLPTWDDKLAEQFIDAFRGRGPENPVR